MLGMREVIPGMPAQGVYLVNCRVLSASGFHVDTPSAVCLCLDVRKT
jgi:hypothetical protein